MSENETSEVIENSNEGGEVRGPAPQRGGDKKAYDGAENFEDYIDNLKDEPEDDKDESDEGEGSESLEGNDSEPKTKESKEKPKEADEKEGKEPKAPDKIKIKTKINGEEKEEELSVEDITKNYQKYKAADQKFSEAARLRKEAEYTLRYLKENPAEVLEKLGLNVTELAENHIAEIIKMESMTSEQREAHKIIKENERLKKLNEQSELTQKHQIIAQKTQEVYEKINAEIIDVLKESKLPKKPFVVARIASLLKAQVGKPEKLSTKQIVEGIKKQDAEYTREILKEMDGEDIAEILGAEIVDKVRKHNVSKFKSNSKFKSSNAGRQNAKASGKKEVMTFDDFDAYIDSL